MTVSGPCSAILARKVSAMVSSASSQEISSNRPLPLGPVRRIGCSTRSGL